MSKKMLSVGMAVLAMFVVLALAMPAAAQEVDLRPPASSAEYCNTVDVEIWVNAENFQGGQINLTYDPTCANVTDWEKTTTFPLGVWDTSIAGREWMTFTATASLTGEYLIGTLTIHCVREEGECNTPLDFVTTGVQRCALFDPQGGEILPTDWKDGTFTGNPAVPDTEPPYTAGHDPAPGDTNVPVDTNIVVHVLDDRPNDRGVNRWSIVMTVEGAPAVPLTITGTPADYRVEYDPPVDFDEGQVVDVTIDASDLAGNVMPTDRYSFRIVGAPAAVPLLGPPAIVALAAILGIIATTLIIRNKKKGMK